MDVYKVVDGCAYECMCLLISVRNDELVVLVFLEMRGYTGAHVHTSKVSNFQVLFRIVG